MKEIILKKRPDYGHYEQAYECTRGRNLQVETLNEIIKKNLEGEEYPDFVYEDFKRLAIRCILREKFSTSYIYRCHYRSDMEKHVNSYIFRIALYYKPTKDFMEEFPDVWITEFSVLDTEEIRNILNIKVV